MGLGFFLLDDDTLGLSSVVAPFGQNRTVHPCRDVGATVGGTDFDRFRVGADTGVD